MLLLYVLTDISVYVRILIGICFTFTRFIRIGDYVPVYSDINRLHSMLHIHVIYKAYISAVL